MKSILTSLLGITFLLCGFVQTGKAQTKTIVVGLVTNHQPVIADQSQATQVLMSNLPPSAIVSGIDIIYVETEHKYYMRGKVANDRILAIAIRLTEKESVLSLSSGPGLAIVCIGIDKCNDCVSKTAEGNEVCQCRSSSSGSIGYCESVAKTTISL